MADTRIGGPDFYSLLSQGAIVERMDPSVVEDGVLAPDGVEGTLSTTETDVIYELEDYDTELL